MRISFLFLLVLLAAGSAEADLCDAAWLGTASGSAARELVSGGADVDRVCDTDRNRPLHQALLNPRTDPDVIRALVEAGADVAAENAHRASPVRYAQERFDRAMQYFRPGTGPYAREQAIYEAVFDRVARDGSGKAGLAAAGADTRTETRQQSDRQAGRRGPPPLKTERGAGRIFRDCPSCPEMVTQPGGRLALGRFEVTRGEYAAFVSATQHVASGCYDNTTGDTWQSPGFEQTDRHPVVCVAWDDTQAYVAWLSRTTDAEYRLPTEEEWSRAARGTSVGCAANGLHVCDDGATFTAPVGSYSSNGVGLFDMVGNAWEWTQDCWDDACSRRVVRGGSWDSMADDLLPDARRGFSTDKRWFPLSRGFRVARTLD